MNALFGLAAPKAAQVATNATSNALGAFTRPFGQFFQAAVEEGDASAGAASASAAHEASSLEDLISRRLQELLNSLGAEADEEALIRFDEITGEIHVDGHLSSPAIEAALKNDPQLMADLKRLATLQSEFDPSVSPADWELQARVTESRRAELRWS
jgi:hypothetical protein